MRKKINFGIYIANFDIFESPIDYLDLAVATEENSWDGFFMWDHTVGIPGKPASETFTTLSAIASKTNNIKIGTTVTGLPRHRPWNLARKVATIDHISNGRFIFGIGLGARDEYSPFNEENDNKILKEKVDESLQIIQGIFEKDHFSFSGKHYQLNDVSFNPKPKQKNLPIWVAGTWPYKGPFRRAAKFNGIFPLSADPDEIRLSPKEYQDIISFINQFRDPKSDFDVVSHMYTTGNKEDDAWISDYIDVGVNWLIEVIYPGRASKKEIFDRIKKGPPSI